ncbi:MAG: hypothetical protein AABX07_00270 [Nanoarchaeota archaeon]
MKKRASIELSMGTIVIIVLGVTMLILGMILVRGVMCSALGLTSDINTKLSSELERYFGETGDEIVCIGEKGESNIVPGGTSYIWCSIKAPEEAVYTISLVDYSTTVGSLSKSTIKSWIKKEKDSWGVVPNDNKPKAPITLSIPKNAPEGSLSFKIEAKKKIKGETVETTILSEDLNFKITRVGFVKSAMC